MHDHLTNPPIEEEQDISVTSSQETTKIPLFERDSLMTEYIAMERAGLVIIPGLFEILKKIFFVVHEHKEEKVGATYSAGKNFMFGVGYNKLTDWQSDITNLISNIGKLKKYCNMFGVPLVPFKASMMDDCYTTFEGWDHPDLDTFVATMFLAFRDSDSTNAFYPTYTYNTATWRFIFKETPDETYERHMLMKLVNQYNANYNLYGGLMTVLTPTTQDFIPFARIDQDESSQAADHGFYPYSLQSDAVLPLLFRFAATMEQTNTLNMSITGADISADNDLSFPLYLWWKGYKKYGTMKNSILDNIVMEYIADKLNLQNVKKNNFSSIT
jgi:hypothetical protein